MSNQRVEDDKLYSWEDIKNLGWSGILLGNGASIAVWDLFRYNSLYQQAASVALEHSLSPEDQAIFATMETTNFEQVLASLATAEMVCKVLHQDSQAIRVCYDGIKLALAEAIHAIHIAWSKIPESTFKKIHAALLPFGFIYTTNYDLLLYWSIMSEKARGFKDYFWDGSFEISNTEVWDKSTKVLYLHGGLHLYRYQSGETFKQKTEPFMNLLDAFIGPHMPEIVPLIVTEGTSKDKRASIYHSDYLSFALSKFAGHEGPLVVLGHSLSDSDEHILESMRRWGNSRIAISIKRGTSDEIIAFKTRIHRELPDAIIQFFDAETHPLGDLALKVDLI